MEKGMHNGAFAAPIWFLVFHVWILLRLGVCIFILGLSVRV